MRNPARLRGSRALALLLLAPAVLLCLLPITYALALELWFSVSSAAPGTDGGFVGLANFQFLAGLDSFWQMLFNSAAYLVSGTLLKLLFGLLMALALVRPFPGRRLLYAGLFLPFIFPVVLGTIAWYFLLTNVHGALDYLLQGAHLTQQPLDLKSRLPLLSVVAVNVWHGSALFGVLLLAGMRSVPADQLDAAVVDGAAPVRRFLHIVVPYLRPAAVLGCLLSVLGNFGDFATVELLTRGGPLGRSQIVSTFAFENALLSGALGLGAAVALVMVPVYLVALAVAFRLIRE
ncbi:MAG TPA: sugar ABC transporter permease [Candidatus Dormibacteraeota bacterium]